MRVLVERARIGLLSVFFFQAEDGIRDLVRSRGLGDVYKRQAYGSVVGIIEGQTPGKTILLDAHTDTVGISPGVPWVHDPFGALIENDAIYGRGTADMKGCLLYTSPSPRDRTRSRMPSSA